jgi:putative addiction module component (TIGR02574 family)
MRPPTKDRVQIVDEIIASVDESPFDSKVEQAWEVEIMGRWEAVTEGKAKLIDAEEVSARVQARLGAVRRRRRQRPRRAPGRVLPLRVRWHVTRHTFASHLVMRGVPLKAVQELLGHTDIKTTMRYAHLAPAVRREAVESLSRPAPAWHRRRAGSTAPVEEPKN